MRADVSWRARLRGRETFVRFQPIVSEPLLGKYPTAKEVCKWPRVTINKDIRLALNDLFHLDWVKLAGGASARLRDAARGAVGWEGGACSCAGAPSRC
eukprot:879307-Pleurochrysis_carterae.AAC.1